MLGGQSFLVFITLKISPRLIRELGHFAVLNREPLEFSVGCEGSEEIAFPPRISSQYHSRAFVGRDRAISDHFLQCNVGFVEQMLEPRRSVIGERWKYDD